MAVFADACSGPLSKSVPKGSAGSSRGLTVLVGRVLEGKTEWLAANERIAEIVRQVPKSMLNPPQDVDVGILGEFGGLGG